MKILIDINHPAQIHFFKNFIIELKQKKHDVLIITNDKDVTIDLLSDINCKYITMGKPGTNIFDKIIRLIYQIIFMVILVLNYNPNLCLGFGSIRLSIVSFITQKKCILYDDDEYSFKYYRYFSQHVFVFSGFKYENNKICKINCDKEFAYLHRSVFKPLPISKLNLPRKHDKLVIFRFVSWTAFHDINQNGISINGSTS